MCYIMKEDISQPEWTDLVLIQLSQFLLNQPLGKYNVCISVQNSQKKAGKDNRDLICVCGARQKVVSAC